MEILCLSLRTGVAADAFWAVLEAEGIQCLYSEEEGDVAKLFISSEGLDVSRLDRPEITGWKPLTYEGVDWGAQWAAFGENFYDNRLHLQLGAGAKPQEIILEPGGGFGDFSHPTTRLVFDLLSQVVKGKRVLDLGTGSGVLALAAVAYGAQEVLAVDIVPEAIEHARLNVSLNGFDVDVDNMDGIQNRHAPCEVVLMNMISSEQRQAWASMGYWAKAAKVLVVSGVLEEEEGPYLNSWRESGWDVQEKRSESGWMAMVLVRS